MRTFSISYSPASCSPHAARLVPPTDPRSEGRVQLSHDRLADGDAGLSREESGLLVGYSKHTIASIEHGRRMPDRGFVQSAEPVPGNTGALRKAAPHLSRQAGLASWFVQWARLEATAVSPYAYECRRHTGGDEVTRELLDRLIELIESNWNVEFQIMPPRRVTHAGLDGPMRLAETPEHRWFAYSEGQQNGRLISDPKEISVLQQRYAEPRSHAPTSEDSLSLLKRMRGAP
ncbi:Scr1 family TA system antitoxin-like transcriptional regulator [Streptomyces sp. 2131.1]|uniref:Scr1 family TA system antitoxin-like transcriptional regulator n=1 Tax=Streptomyces sp. 2131.1 TaxID=1855346 RepID=UPI00352548AB